MQYEQVKEFNKDLAIVKKDDKWGIVDNSGKAVVDFQYRDINFLNETLIQLEKNYQYGLVDKTGNMIFPVQYDGFWRYDWG